MLGHSRRRVMAVGVATVVAWPPPVLGAPVDEDDVPSTAAALQQRHAQCQEQLDVGLVSDAATCLESVYRGLVLRNSQVTNSVYYVLADAVAAFEATASPRNLCRAQVLVTDYLARKPRVTARRFGKSVEALRDQIAAALRTAQDATGSDPCTTPPPAPVAREASTPPPIEAELETTDEPNVTPVPQPAEVRPPVPVKRTTPRRELVLGLPHTALLDASFGVTMAGVASAGFGTALYIYGLECKDGPPRCSTPAPTGVRDAGLAFITAGVATMIIGFGLRFADHRAVRKTLRKLPQPAASPNSVGVVWGQRF